MIVSSALLCLALNVYHESRNQIIPGQYAVALVTLNRAQGDPRRVCVETFKPRQFSWTNASVTKVKGGWRVGQALVPKDHDAWVRAKRIAEVTLQGRMPDITNGSTFFHTKKVRPEWRLAMLPTKTIGDHRFYADPRQSAVTVSLQ